MCRKVQDCNYLFEATLQKSKVELRIITTRVVTWGGARQPPLPPTVAATAAAVADAAAGRASKAAPQTSTPNKCDSTLTRILDILDFHN